MIDCGESAFIYGETVRVESLSASMEESDIHPGTISQEGKCACIYVLCRHFTCAYMYLYVLSVILNHRYYTLGTSQSDL